MHCSMNSSRKVWLFYFFQPISAHCALFMDPQISLFNNFFIKIGSHGTIYIFKNYFATVFFSFQFSAVSKRTFNISFCLCFYTDDWHLASKRSKGKKKLTSLYSSNITFHGNFRFSIYLSLSLSHVSFFSLLSLALLSLSLKQLLEPFSQFPFSLQNYSPYLFRSVITFCFCFCGGLGFKGFWF